MQLGEAYRDVARYQDAVRVIRAALAIDPKPAQVLELAGNGPGGKRADGGRERAFGEATTREPGNGLYAYNRALALNQLGREEEDAAQLTRAASHSGYSNLSSRFDGFETRELQTPRRQTREPEPRDLRTPSTRTST